MKNPKKQLDAVLFLAITILHETAHWKDQVMKGRDTPGEEGHKVNDRIFGKPKGDFDIDDKGCLTRGTKPVDDATKRKWADPKSWK